MGYISSPTLDANCGGFSLLQIFYLAQSAQKPSLKNRAPGFVDKAVEVQWLTARPFYNNRLKIAPKNLQPGTYFTYSQKSNSSLPQTINDQTDFKLRSTATAIKYN